MTHAGRLGIVGGTFDPIHWGHLDAATAAAETLGLTELLFVPSHVPPHRRDTPRASAFHRFAMVALAIQDLPLATASDLELGRPGPSYSADTLAALHAQGWDPSQIFFVIGTDAFAEIATWRSYPAILDMCHFVVVSRSGTPPDAAVGGRPNLLARLATPASLPAHPASTAVIPLTVDTRSVSSTQIRMHVGAGRDIRALVPSSVATYIARNQLYGQGQELA